MQRPQVGLNIIQQFGDSPGLLPRRRVAFMSCQPVEFPLHMSVRFDGVKDDLPALSEYWLEQSGSALTKHRGDDPCTVPHLEEPGVFKLVDSPHRALERFFEEIFDKCRARRASL
jgi:hypothetical protein